MNVVCPGNSRMKQRPRKPVVPRPAEETLRRAAAAGTDKAADWPPCVERSSPRNAESPELLPYGDKIRQGTL